LARRIRLNERQKIALSEAVIAYEGSQAELGRQVGLSPADMSRVKKGQKNSLPRVALRGLVLTLRLDYGSFFEQFELDLDDERIIEIERALSAQLRQLQAEVQGSLKGSSFTLFVGIRVEGAVEKVYQGRVQLEPRPEVPRPPTRSATAA